MGWHCRSPQRSGAEENDVAIDLAWSISKQVIILAAPLASAAAITVVARSTSMTTATSVFSSITPRRGSREAEIFISHPEKKTVMHDWASPRSLKGDSNRQRLDDHQSHDLPSGSCAKLGNELFRFIAVLRVAGDLRNANKSGFGEAAKHSNGFRDLIGFG